MRVGVDVSWSTVTSSSTTVTATIKLFTANQYRYNDPQVLTRTGHLSGDVAFNNDSSGGAVLRNTVTHTVAYGSSYGVSPGTRTFGARISGTYNGVTPSVSVTYNIPPRPLATPLAPTDFVATRVSDTTTNLTWTVNAPAERPEVTNTIEQREMVGPNSAWGAWVGIGATSGGTTSNTRTTLQANRIYQWRIRSNNDAGSSDWTLSNLVYNSPAAPTNVVGALGSAGTTVLVNWVPTWPQGSDYTVSVERSVAGGAWTEVASGLVYNATQWTDTSPGGGTNQYRVRARVVPTGLYGAYGVSNVVSAVGPPLAPTNLTPNGVKLDLNKAQTLSWTHRPSGDGAPQTGFQIAVSTDAGATWTTITTQASPTSSWTMPGGTLTNQLYQWRVRTRGVEESGYGPWSSFATFQGVSTPVVTLTYPTATVVQMPLRVEWLYDQAELSAQVTYQAQILLSADGTVLLEDDLVYSDETTHGFEFLPDSPQSYTFRVRARSADGVWSDWASTVLLVDLPDPPTVTLVGDYDPCGGAVTLGMLIGPDGPGIVPLVSVTIQRRVLPSDVWVTLITGLDGSATWFDPLPATNGVTQYRAISYSDVPSTVIGPIHEVRGTDGDPGGGNWVWINYGPGFGTSRRFQGDPKVSTSSARTQEAVTFLGRTRPVLLAGISTSLRISASGVVRWSAECPDRHGDCGFDSHALEWEATGLEATLVAYRDWTGRRIFGMSEGVQVTERSPGLSEVSVGVTEVDYTERYV